MQYGKFASVYDKLMKDVDYDAWASRVLSLIPEGASVLECACGTGEITRRIAAAGHAVTATDSSEDMLRVASEKLRLLGADDFTVRFARMDMRSVSVHKPVECVLCCCDGVNYLLCREDVKKFFNSANAALATGGLMLFDVSSRYKLEKVIGCSTFADNDADTPYLWLNAYDDETKLIEMELSFFVRKGDGYERFDENHIQRAHSVNELMSWLDQCGFDAKAYDFDTMDEPGPDSERIQFVARKL